MKGDHIASGPDKRPDLHVHIYHNKAGGKSRCLGKYRLPGLEPLPGTTHHLTDSEVDNLAGWLRKPQQLHKLNDCLKSTIFDSHRLAENFGPLGEVVEAGGQTYINIRIPISRSIHSSP